MRVRTQSLLTVVVVVANLVGAAVVLVLNLWVIPGPSILTRERVFAVAVLVPSYVVVAVVIGVVWGTRRLLPCVRAVTTDASPSAEAQTAVLRAPARLLVVQLALWLTAALLFSLLSIPYGPRVTLRTALSVVLGGAVTCTHAYLLSELVLRPVAARALASPVPKSVRLPGLAVRSFLAWLAGTAIPVGGLMVVAIAALAYGDVSAESLSIAILGLGGVTIGAGFLLSRTANRATLDPVAALRTALARLQEGHLDTRIVVYDGTELGRLQAGFNQMVEGLAERAQLRDLFSRHVGEPVAEAALEGRFASGGELRDLAAVFVDIVGSTELASRCEPEEVVALLNRFFAVVVDVVDSHGGLVNKFVGDAALAVFGAPGALDDPCGAALAAARELARRLPSEVPELPAGVGVAAGPAVAGNVGDERRFEFTVIGDPVNEAARLTKLAKAVPGRVLASMDAVAGAGGGEQREWVECGEVVVEGRSLPTRLAVPRTGRAAGTVEE